jgi:hypothetical protein
MSKIAVSSPASGTATYTISAPAGSTDRTISLPDNTGTILTTATAGVPINGPAFASGDSAQTTVSTATTTAFANFSASFFDTASAFDRTTGRFTPQVAGYYQINAAVSYGNNGVLASAVVANISKNDATVASGVVSTTGGVGYPTPTASTVVYLNGSTDYVRVSTYHNASGSAINVVGKISGALIRSAT